MSHTFIGYNDFAFICNSDYSGEIIVRDRKTYNEKTGEGEQSFSYQQLHDWVMPYNLKIDQSNSFKEFVNIPPEAVKEFIAHSYDGAIRRYLADLAYSDMFNMISNEDNILKIKKLQQEFI